MSMSIWEAYKEKNGVTPLDMLNPMTNYVEDDVYSSRMSICRACPELIQLTAQCKKCGCLMAIKNKLEAAKCPIGKW
jgi:hypothetical protein